MILTPQQVDEVLHSSERLYGTQEIEQHVQRMAEEITAEISKANPVLLSVMIGGLIPTGMLLKHMSFPLEMDYVHATRYKGETRGGTIEWRVKAKTSLQDRTVLVIDDILDGGVTLKEIIEHCKSAGAKRVLSAVLVEKIGSRDPNGLDKADFTGLTVPNKYVFGYGMDYKNYLRNAPGIYVIDERYE